MILASHVPLTGTVLQAAVRALCGVRHSVFAQALESLRRIRDAQVAMKMCVKDYPLGPWQDVVLREEQHVRPLRALCRLPRVFILLLREIVRRRAFVRVYEEVCLALCEPSV